MAMPGEHTHEHVESDEIRAMCVADGQTTTWVYTKKRSMLGLMTTMKWVCTRCGAAQENEPAAS